MTKIGPTGPSLAEAERIVHSLPTQLQDDLRLLGGQQFSEYLTSVYEATPEEEREHHLPIRKLAHLSDKEGKTRTIAMLDWWSQTVLRRYHQDQMRILKRIPSDFTYQGNSCEWLSHGTGDYYSFDLTNATDRFPVELQQVVISAMYGREAGKA